MKKRIKILDIVVTPLYILFFVTTISIGIYKKAWLIDLLFIEILLIGVLFFVAGYFQIFKKTLVSTWSKYDYFCWARIAKKLTSEKSVSKVFLKALFIEGIFYLSLGIFMILFFVMAKIITAQ